jgi:monodechloroaminopyrrolnitrin synthase
VRSAQALVRALRTVITFRGRHLGIASQVYEADMQDFAAGSAGGSVDLLRQILDLTRLNACLASGR